MNLYLAGDIYSDLCYKALKERPDVKISIEQNPTNYKLPLYRLYSFAYTSNFTGALEYIPHLKNVMLDSGAFTFQKKNSTAGVKMNTYLSKYIDFINRYDIKLFYEMDIDQIVGYKKVLEYRKILEQETGKKCIPVWHAPRGIDDYLETCDSYDYIAIGGLAAGEEFGSKNFIHLSWFINEAHKRKTKVHALGFTSLKMLPFLHFDSVDSSTWTTGGRFGRIYKFDGRRMLDFVRPDGHRVISKDLTVHNFLEWVKYAEYAETNF